MKTLVKRKAEGEWLSLSPTQKDKNQIKICQVLAAGARVKRLTAKMARQARAKAGINS